MAAGTVVPCRGTGKPASPRTEVSYLMAVPAPPLGSRIHRTLTALGVEPAHRLGIGCSGGPDSIALAHAALTLAREGALGPVVLVHVNHGLRADAAADADLVSALGARLGAPVEVCEVTVDRGQA